MLTDFTPQKKQSHVLLTLEQDVLELDGHTCPPKPVIHFRYLAMFSNHAHSIKQRITLNYSFQGGGVCMCDHGKPPLCRNAPDSESSHVLVPPKYLRGTQVTESKEFCWRPNGDDFEFSIALEGTSEPVSAFTSVDLLRRYSARIQVSTTVKKEKL